MKLFWRRTAFVLLMLWGGISQAGPQNRWVLNPENQHYYLRMDNVNWEDLKTASNTLGGYPVTIGNAVEETWLKRKSALVANDTLIGLTDEDQEGTWKWWNGESLNYQNWAPDESNQTESEDCVIISRCKIFQGAWHDASAQLKFCGIVERDTVPDPPIAISEGCVAWVKNPSNGHFYLPMHGFTWNALKTAANLAGAYLVSIQSDEEQQWILSQSGMFDPGQCFVTGFTDEEQEGNWTWRSGEPITFQNWKNGEPNGGERENILNICGKDARWNDIAQGDFFSAVLERNAPPTFFATIQEGVWVINPADGHAYYRTAKQYFPNDARWVAQAFGGALLAIETVDEQGWLLRESGLLWPNENVWLGLSDAAQENSWIWPNGTSPEFTWWQNAEPNGGTRENYALFVVQENNILGAWVDVDENWQAAAIIECDTPPKNLPVLFDNKPLETALLKAIGKPAPPLTEQDLVQLLRLDLSRNNLTSIEGIEKCSSVAFLNLSNNQIKDFTPLQALKNLRELDIGYNPREITLDALSALPNLHCLKIPGLHLADFAFLKNMTHLDTLGFWENQIADLSPLQNLTALKTLVFMGNQVANLAPLARLTELREINAEGNRIQDLSPLAQLSNLDRLAMGYNTIQDIEPLRRCAALRYLALNNNKINTSEPLRPLVQLEELYINENPIKNIAPVAELSNLRVFAFYGFSDPSWGVQDISPIARLNKLQRLYLGGNPITDLSPVKNLKNLEVLDIWTTRTKDISPLAGLQMLKELGLANNQISDLSPLENLSELQALNLDTNQIQSIDALSKLYRLHSLRLSGNAIVDISPVSSLYNLNLFTARNNKISDISPLKTCKALTRLELERNSIQDISPVSMLTALDYLDLGNNLLKDLSPLRPLTKLTFLNIEKNRFVTFDSLPPIASLKYLNAGACGIWNVEPLRSLPALCALALHENNVSDLAPLAGAQNLLALFMPGNLIKDISPLANLSQMRLLDLNNNKIQNVEKLAQVPLLEEIHLQGNQISDLNALAAFADKSNVEPKMKSLTNADEQLRNCMNAWNEAQHYLPLKE